MNMLRASLFVLVLSVASLPVIAPASTPESDYTVTASTQTFVLTRGTPLYDAWKAFIDQQNVGRRKLGPVKGPGLPYEVGRITLATSSGPPMPLPATGIEGQTLTMTSQTATIYQSWIYVFEGRAGGWREFSYRGYACRHPKEGGEICEP